MMFLSKWIVIVFEFGGIALAISILMKISKSNMLQASIDLRKMRSSIFLLFPFIILNSLGLGDILVRHFGGEIYPAGIVFVNNLLLGIFFIGFLIFLKQSITFKPDKSQNKAIEATK